MCYGQQILSVFFMILMTLMSQNERNQFFSPFFVGTKGLRDKFCNDILFELFESINFHRICSV